VNTFAPNVRTRVVNGQVWLEGTVDNFDQAKRATIVAQLYLPELRPGDALEGEPTVQRIQRGLIQNFIVINPPPPRKEEKLVRVTIHFVELSKDYNKLFGFKWQPGFTQDTQVQIGTNQAGQSGASGGTSFTATISSLFPKLQSAQNAGYARILKSGTLIVRSGQPAKLADQTVIPFPMVGPNGQVVTSVANVGLQFGVTPLILGGSDDIQMDLKMEQVNLTGKAGTTPITAQHSVETKVYVKSGESAALAGVTSSDVRTDFNKDDPNQGTFGQSESGAQTDALFNLLRSKNYQKKRSQLVIFVTPQIMQNASEGTADMKRNFRVKADLK
jgi:pilus assembly protein CpaC